MLRTPLTLTVVATAAVLVLAGCGTVRLGSAAVTNTDRISSATVAAQVSNLNQAHQADKAKVQAAMQARKKCRGSRAGCDMVSLSRRRQLRCRRHSSH